MKQRFAILGLDQIGASFSLALKSHADMFECIGFDPDPDVLKRAHKIGIIDRKEPRVTSAVKDADLVLMTPSVETFPSFLESFAVELNGGTVVLDASPIISSHIERAQKLLPEDCFFIGLNPTINPKYLNDIYPGIEGAKPDLFENGILAITPAKPTPAKIVDYIVHITKLLGATPLFGDPAEIDSFVAAAYLMPTLMAAAFLTDISSQVSWREIQRITGRPFVRLAGILEDVSSSQAIVPSVLANPENIVWRMDGMIQKLMEIKERIRSQDRESLQVMFETAQQAVAEFQKKRFLLELSDEERDKAKSKASDVIANYLWPRYKRE